MEGWNMHVMIILKVPPGNAEKMGELFETVPKLPDSVTREAVYTTMDGVVKHYVIFKIEDAKVEEGMDGLIARIAGYSVVDGFRWKIKWVRSRPPDDEN